MQQGRLGVLDLCPYRVDLQHGGHDDDYSRLFAMSGLASVRACGRSDLSTEAPLHNVLFWSCFLARFFQSEPFGRELVYLVDRNGGESEGVIGHVVPAGWRWRY